MWALGWNVSSVDLFLLRNLGLGFCIPFDQDFLKIVMVSLEVSTTVEHSIYNEETLLIGFETDEMLKWLILYRNG